MRSLDRKKIHTIFFKVKEKEDTRRGKVKELQKLKDNAIFKNTSFVVMAGKHVTVYRTG